MLLSSAAVLLCCFAGRLPIAHAQIEGGPHAGTSSGTPSASASVSATPSPVPSIVTGAISYLFDGTDKHGHSHGHPHRGGNGAANVWNDPESVFGVTFAVPAASGFQIDTMTINVASTPCQPVTVALWPVDESDGGIVGPEVANYTVTLCPEVEGDYVTIGLPSAFQALGYDGTTYGLTWTFGTGAYTAGPTSVDPPTPGLTSAVSMLLNGVPAAPGNWQPIQVTGRVLPLFDSTAALRVLWDGYTEHIQYPLGFDVDGVVFKVPWNTGLSEFYQLTSVTMRFDAQPHLAGITFFLIPANADGSLVNGPYNWAAVVQSFHRFTPSGDYQTFSLTDSDISMANPPTPDLGGVFMCDPRVSQYWALAWRTKTDQGLRGPFSAVPPQAGIARPIGSIQRGLPRADGLYPPIMVNGVTAPVPSYSPTSSQTQTASPSTTPSNTPSPSTTGTVSTSFSTTPTPSTTATVSASFSNTASGSRTASSTATVSTSLSNTATASVTATVSTSLSNTATSSKTSSVSASFSHTSTPTATVSSTVTTAPIFQLVSSTNLPSAPALTQPVSAVPAAVSAPYGILLPVYIPGNDDDDFLHGNGARDASCNVVVALSYANSAVPALSWQTFSIVQTNGGDPKNCASQGTCAVSAVVKLRTGYTANINFGAIQQTKHVQLQLYYQGAGGSFVQTPLLSAVDVKECPGGHR